MSRIKSSVVAIAMTAMLTAILVCLCLLKVWVAVGAIIGAFAAVGLICCTDWMIGWLSEKPKEPAILEPVMCGPEEKSDEDDVPEVVTETVEEIMRDVRS